MLLISLENGLHVCFAFSMFITLTCSVSTYTVKHDYSEHTYNELMLTVTVIFIPCDYITCCKLDGYNELHL